MESDTTITDARLQQLKESEERLRSIVEAAVDAIIVIDARGNIEAFNPGAERLFGYTAAFSLLSATASIRSGYIAFSCNLLLRSRLNITTNIPRSFIRMTWST